MSRREARPGEDVGVEWAVADMGDREAVAKAVMGVDVVIHAASLPFRGRADQIGTATVAEAAKEARVGHLIYISIIGLEQMRKFGYYQSKLDCEEIVRESGLPFSILRGAQFPWFVESFIKTFTAPPVAFVPTDWQFQVIDTRDMAAHIVTAVQAGPSGGIIDVAGPQVQTLGTMAAAWMEAKGIRKPVLYLPTLGQPFKGFKAGHNTTGQPGGSISWADWLREKYGPRPERDSALAGEGSQ
jgi:uncharacterized protein YbjT (DUF2867 family)